MISVKRCEIFWRSFFGLGLVARISLYMMVFEVTCDWLRDAKFFLVVILDLDLVLECHFIFLELCCDRLKDMKFFLA